MSCTINGSAGLTTNSGALYNGISSGTAVSASGTSVDFTSIPSWVKRITVMLYGVSTNGSSQLQIQIGSGSVVTSGYGSGASFAASAGTYTGIITSGLILEPVNSASASAIRYGSAIINLVGSNIWVSQSSLFSSASAVSAGGGASSALSGALDRIRITTVNGTDTFDAGSINILYE